MKTKIVYISGAEVFEMADVRSAFDEVRNTLGLDKDTILFGVPVDEDDSVLSVKPVENTSGNQQQEQEIKPEKKLHKKSVKKQLTETSAIDINIPTNTATNSQDSSKIVPILSVLSSNEKQDDNIVSKTDSIETSKTQAVITETQIQNIDEIFEDQEIIDAPTSVSEEKQTLEHLFNSITPLDDIVDDLPSANTEETNMDNANTDVLGQLATEFAETANSIPVQKTTNHGTISRLKNIIPFKREKKSTTSDLANDLFGWAGDAANDDDLSNFFSTGTSSNR